MIVKPLDTVGFNVATPPVNKYVPVLPSSTVPVEATQSCAELVAAIAKMNTNNRKMRRPKVYEPSLCMVSPPRWDANC